MTQEQAQKEGSVKGAILYREIVMVSGKYTGYNVAFVPATILISWLMKFNQNKNKEAIKKRNPAYALLEMYISEYRDTIYIEYLKDHATARKFISSQNQ